MRTRVLRLPSRGGGHSASPRGGARGVGLELGLGLGFRVRVRVGLGLGLGDEARADSLQEDTIGK